MTRVLIVGTPRSGTTWIGQALGRSRETVYVHEPDGPNDAFALKAKLGRGLHNDLLPGDVAPDYETLWRAAFAGGQFDRSWRGRLAKRLVDTSSVADRSAALHGETVSLRLRGAIALAPPLRPREQVNVVAKSVHACLAVEWIVDRFGPQVVVVRRNPLNVLASWKTLGQGGDPRVLDHLAAVALRRWGLRLPVNGASQFARRAMSYGVLMGALSSAASRHPTWHEIRHEDVCLDPVARISAFAPLVGLEFSDAVESYLLRSNQPGDRYETKRIASSVVEKWRDILTDSEVDEALATLTAFPDELRLVD